VLIEFADYLALFEAPQNDTRALAVIEQARNLRPDKTLQYLINSHHHFDHSGGVRAAVSEGLTIITHEDNADFFKDLVVRPHTIQQDALTRFPNELTLELVTGDEVYELSDGTHALQLVRILDDAHSSSILMGYLPRERLMIEADAFSPNSRAAPFAANLLKNVRGLDWQVDRIVPIHGGVSEFETLKETVENETQNP
jgi:glyoxylase-like metal-dependent hydrolase (beta-lactamase superfamily II)